MGILFALGACFSWGVGDFLIQRSIRKFGAGIALFFVTAFGTVILLPFVWSELPTIFSVSDKSAILWGASLILFIACLLDFECLRIGKISVIEPIFSFEIAITAFLGSWLIHEQLTALQIILLALLICGIFLVSFRRLRSSGMVKIERGVLIAVAATILMGTASFLFGLGARQTSPLMISWFTSAFITIAMAGYLTWSGQWRHLGQQWRTSKSLILWVGLLDNLAWLLWAYSVLTLPIAIATAITASYIIISSLLGLWLNRERLHLHQLIGLAIAIASGVALATTLE